MSQIVNLTDHDLTIDDIVYPPSGIVARIRSVNNLAFIFEGIPVYELSSSRIHDLPSPQDGILYVTSFQLSREANRLDVVAPNSRDADRDEYGNIVNIHSFILPRGITQ